MSLTGSSLHRLGYRSLIWAARYATSPARVAIWDRAWAAAAQRLSGVTMTQIHGRSVTLNTGYAYPAFARRWPTYNDPLVELVHQARTVADRAIVVIDVGAAIGDTVLLLMERCPGDVCRYHCFEGDPEFIEYLALNLGKDEEVRLHFGMLSDKEGEEAALVRTHSGTASAQGATRQPTTTLDALLRDESVVDVLKVDTDGFDGKVLAGAVGVLDRHRPATIFEWHPLLYRATGQDWRVPFEVLHAHGYSSFIWFTKEGELSHLDHTYQPRSVEMLAELCLSGDGPRPDWHYDIVALHEKSDISPTRVAGLRFARSHRKP